MGWDNTSRRSPVEPIISNHANGGLEKVKLRNRTGNLYIDMAATGRITTAKVQNAVGGISQVRVNPLPVSSKRLTKI